MGVTGTAHDRRWSRPSSPALVLGAVLVAAVPVLLHGRSGDSWFVGDDWSMLANRSPVHLESWFRPQNGHWNTLPYAVYRTLYALDGVWHFGWYRLVAVLTHLAVVAMLWRLLRRIGVPGWVALAAVAPLTVMDDAANMLAPSQMGLNGSVAFGLAALTASSHDGPFGRADVAAVGLGLASCLCSGLGPVFALVIGATALVRRGRRVALLLAGPSLLAQLCWQLVTHARGPAPTRVDAARMWAWVREGVTATCSAPTGSTIAAVLLFAATTVGFVRHVRRFGAAELRGRLAPVLPLLGGVVVHFAVTSTQRYYLGDAYARTDRYVYVGIVFVLPAIAIAASELVVAVEGRAWAAGALAAVPLLALYVGIPSNVDTLYSPPVIDFGRTKALLLGLPSRPLAAEVRQDLHPDPVLLTARAVTVGWLRGAAADGDLPPAPPISADTAAAIDLRLSLGRWSLPDSSTPDCSAVPASVDLSLRAGDRVRVDRSVLVQRLSEGAVVGPVVELYLSDRFAPEDTLEAEMDVDVRVSAADGGELTVCRP